MVAGGLRLDFLLLNWHVVQLVDYLAFGDSLPFDDRLTVGMLENEEHRGTNIGGDAGAVVGERDGLAQDLDRLCDVGFLGRLDFNRGRGSCFFLGGSAAATQSAQGKEETDHQ